jgi:hypothetical protein
VLRATLLLLVATAAPAATPDLLLGKAYPHEVSVAFHQGLLHWLDSLTVAGGAGMTAGKSAPAHHEQYLKTLGDLSAEDIRLLSQFRAVRRGWARGAPEQERDALTLAFFETPNLETALARATGLLGEAEGGRLAESVRHFAAGYRKIWRDGAIVRSWLDRVRRDERREQLAGFLVQVARWLDVPAAATPRPRLVLAPVPAGHGTHAQAIGRQLLIEIRPREGLAEEAAPIVHENVHLLLRRIPAERWAQLEAAASAVEPHGSEAWRTLQEALPTAIAQGIVDSRFRPRRWSRRQAWDHMPSVDRYAKRIHPLVKSALEGGGRFDEAFVRELAAAYSPAP